MGLRYDFAGYGFSSYFKTILSRWNCRTRRVSPYAGFLCLPKLRNNNIYIYTITSLYRYTWTAAQCFQLSFIPMIREGLPPPSPLII